MVSMVHGKGLSQRALHAPVISWAAYHCRMFITRMASAMPLPAAAAAAATLELQAV